MRHRLVSALALILVSLTSTGCPGSVVGMVKQAEILDRYAGGPDGGSKKEPDYQDCNMRFGTSGSRFFSADPPEEVHACMREKGYTVAP